MNGYIHKHDVVYREHNTSNSVVELSIKVKTYHFYLEIFWWMDIISFQSLLNDIKLLYHHRNQILEPG